MPNTRSETVNSPAVAPSIAVALVDSPNESTAANAKSKGKQPRCPWCGWSPGSNRKVKKEDGSTVAPGCIGCYRVRHGRLPIEALTEPPRSDPIQWIVWGREDGRWSIVGQASTLTDAKAIGRRADVSKVQIMAPGHHPEEGVRRDAGLTHGQEPRNAP